MKAFRGLALTTATVALGALALAAPGSAAPRVSNAMPPIHSLGVFTGSNGNGNGNGKGGGKGGGANLSYNGGTPDGAATPIGVETTPKVYLVFWGSQWNNNDPSSEAATLEGFLGSVGGSNWNNIVTQYCQGVAVGTVTCSGRNLAGNQSGVLAGVWNDTSAPAPKRSSQAQLAAEAVTAASHFGLSASDNQSAQYVIATASGDNPSGFGSSYCAWHSSTTSNNGLIAYTNLPYITDAGSSCGANFPGTGPYGGITIVEGHEFAETETDPFPSTGWTDSSGAEIGDKCAWNSLTSDVSFGGVQYAVQPLWNNTATGCTLS